MKNFHYYEVGPTSAMRRQWWLAQRWPTVGTTLWNLSDKNQ